MGRKPSRNLNLPAGMRARHRKNKTYYYLDLGGEPRKEIPLGPDYAMAVKKWGDIHVSEKPRHQALITFRYAAERYKREILPQKAPATQKDNGRELNKLYEFFDNPPAPLDTIEPIHIRQYLDWRVQDAVKRLREKAKPVKGTEGQVRANREIALFSHIWNFARDQGLTNAANPCSGVKKFREPGRDIYVEDETYDAVLTEMDKATVHVMEMAYLTAQRPADVLKLKLTDIRDGALCIQQNKTKKRLRILLEGRLALLVKTLSKRPPTVGKVHSLALMRNARGEALTLEGLRTRFTKARTKAAIKARLQQDEARALAIEAFQFRDLRAKAGTDKEETAGLAAAKDQLGHSNENMTNRYVRHRKGKLVTPTC